MSGAVVTRAIRIAPTAKSRICVRASGFRSWRHKPAVQNGPAYVKIRFIMTSLVSTSWYLLRSGPGGHAHNMALDAALLEAAPFLGRPVLRFYSWSEPAASFGYFQKYAEVEQMTLLRPLVRRPTGGGLVPHDADWTYSLTFPPSDAWHTLKAVRSYHRVHEWIQAAFHKLGIPRSEEH